MSVQLNWNNNIHIIQSCKLEKSDSPPPASGVLWACNEQKTRHRLWQFLVLLTHLGSSAKLIYRNQRRKEKQVNITNKKQINETEMKARKYMHIKLQPTKYDDKPVAAYRIIICILHSQCINCMPLTVLHHYIAIFLRANCACIAVFKQLQYYIHSCRNETTKVHSRNKSKHFCCSRVTVGLEYIWNLGSKLRTKNKIQNIQTNTQKHPNWKVIWHKSTNYKKNGISGK
jgi:hypothetical protein